MFSAMAIPTNIQILHPWNIVAPGDGEKLQAELQQELPPGHRLAGLDAIAVARRFDQDDVLFEISDAETPLVQVHLTFQKEKESKWPSPSSSEIGSSGLRKACCPIINRIMIPKADGQEPRTNSQEPHF
jgi:hypothetical protein